MKIQWNLGLASMIVAGAVVALVSGSLLSPAEARGRSGKGVRAKVAFSGCGDASVVGLGLLSEEPTSEGVKQVEVFLAVRGLPDGKHAVHIHETAACAPCGAAGGHFDPGPNSNTNPDGNHPFHMGDLVNLNVRRGVGWLRTSTSRVTLSPGPLGLFDGDGSAIIIHVNEDSYCTDGPSAGCAGGGRAACGVIELVE